MDIWKYYDITHREHVVCNPMNDEKLDRLVDLLRIPPGASVVDIACGKAEFMMRLALAYKARCVGVDASPFVIAEAKRRVASRAPAANIELLTMDGAAFRPDRPNSFAVASCLGASWIFKGHAGTLTALIGLAEPGGWIVDGEPFWQRDPTAEYLELAGVSKDDFGTHASNVEEAEGMGLELVHTLVSSRDDWDKYEGLQWHAAAEYARTHPDDPDLPEITERVAKAKKAYLRWGRETLGWAIYVYRRR